MEFDLELERLVGPPVPHAATVHERAFACDGVEYTLRFRVPNGGDLEDAAAVASHDVREAERMVLQRCVEEVRVAGEGASNLPAALIAQLGAAMKELDPQGEVILTGTCSSCGEPFEVCCDAAQLVFREMERGRTVRERDVHLLAYHYHWSERDILALTGRQRERYVEGLIKGLAGRNE